FFSVRRPPRSPLFSYTTLFRSFHGDRLEDEHRLRATLRRGAPLLADLLLGLARLQQELLEAEALLADTRLQVGDEVIELVLHEQDRKSTRLNSSHLVISYAAFF